jgi:hypothetical protein
MSKITTFFRTLVKSCSNPAYYLDIFRAKFSFSLKYFFSFQFLTILLTATLILVPLYTLNVKEVVTQAASIYPQDLIISMEKGKVHVNKTLPYAIPVPGSKPLNSLQNLVVFDSDQNFGSIKNFDDYHALAVVTESVFYTKDVKVKETDTRTSVSRDAQIKAYPFPDDGEDFMIDSQLINNFKNMVLNHPIVANKLYIPLAWLVTFAIFLPLLFFIRWLTVMWYSVITFVVTKLFKKALFANHTFSYTKVLQVSLHTITPIILIAYLTGWFGQGWTLAGIWYFLAYLIWTCIVLNRVAVNLVSREAAIEEAQVVSRSSSRVVRRSRVTKSAKKSVKSRR